MSSRTVASTSSGITASARASSGVRTARKAFSGDPVSVERGRPRFDGAHPRPFDHRLAGGFAVDGVLHVLPAEFVRRRLGPVHAEAVLGEVAAVGGDQTALAGIGDQAFGHGGDRVRHVVVPRTAGEGEPAGHGQRPGRVTGRQPQFVGRHLHRGGEARVEVDQRHVVDPGACQFQRAVARDPDGRRGVELGAIADGVGVVGVGARVGKHPTVSRDLQVRRLVDRHQHQRRTLIHHVVRVHQLRVRPADHPVTRTGLGDVVARQRLSAPCIRVRRSHRAEL